MDGQTDIQTDGDYTKRVVTPFGTTRLKILEAMNSEAATDKISHILLKKKKNLLQRFYSPYFSGPENCPLCGNPATPCPL